MQIILNGSAMAHAEAQRFLGEGGATGVCGQIASDAGVTANDEPIELVPGEALAAALACAAEQDASERKSALMDAEAEALAAAEDSPAAALISCWVAVEQRSPGPRQRGALRDLAAQLPERFSGADLDRLVADYRQRD